MDPVGRKKGSVRQGQRDHRGREAEPGDRGLREEDASAPERSGSQDGGTDAERVVGCGGSGAKADRCERTAACNTRTSCYRRGLQTGVTMKMPKLRTLTFETAVIQGYKRLSEFGRRSDGDMYLAGLSVLRVKDITSRKMRGRERSSIKSICLRPKY